MPYVPIPSIGYFRDRITVNKVTKVDNGRGGWTETESEVGEYWGYLEPLSAKNIIQYRQADMNVTTKFSMRFNTAIDTHCVFYARGERFLIDSVIPDREQRFLTILATGEKNYGI
jgi:SPP1 family predicted phage head-tail adaptor